MKMEITQRDKVLLVYLLAIAIIAASYQFGARVFLEKAQANEEQIESLTRELNDLTLIYNNRDNYSQKIVEKQKEIDETMEKFPGGFTQENTLIMLQDIEDSTGAWISRVSFTEEEVVSGEDSASVDQAADQFIEETDGTQAAEDISNGNDTAGGAITLAGISTVSQNLSLDYYCSYNDFKKFLDYIQNYDKRLFVSSLSAAYSPDANEVSGSIVITQYAVYGAGKEIEKPDLSGITTGTDNIFTTLRGTTGTEITVQSIDGTDVMEGTPADTGAENVNPDSADAPSEGETPPDSAPTQDAPAEARPAGGVA